VIEEGPERVTLKARMCVTISTWFTGPYRRVQGSEGITLSIQALVGVYLSGRGCLSVAAHSLKGRVCRVYERGEPRLLYVIYRGY
jgi:hypothetical protein